MERLQQKLKQKEEEQARQEERRINQLEKVSYLRESLIRLSVPLDFGADELNLSFVDVDIVKILSFSKICQKPQLFVNSICGNGKSLV